MPTPEERAHDFLWRVHRHAPRLGEFSIFNRSHYEDVLVVRVHGLAPKSVWKERFGHIRDFEELLAEHGTLILKFFLHITKNEQESRLLEREESPETAWKLNPNDWKERDHWDEYTRAYEDVISKTAAKHAPWIVVPANAKWYRNYVIAESIAQALREHRKGWEKTLEAMGREGRAELDAYRGAGAAGEGRAQEEALEAENGNKNGSPKAAVLNCCEGRGLQRLDGRGLLALRAHLDFELDALVFLQRLEARGLDFREVREEILAAAFRGNEAEALGVVEPLDRTGCHVMCPLNRLKMRASPLTASDTD